MENKKAREILKNTPDNVKKYVSDYANRLVDYYKEIGFVKDEVITQENDGLNYITLNTAKKLSHIVLFNSNQFYLNGVIKKVNGLKKGSIIYNQYYRKSIPISEFLKMKELVKFYNEK